MNRALTTTLVLLALAGVVSGNLFRPCDCAADVQAGARALCHSLTEGAATPRSCCGSCRHEISDEARDLAPDAAGDTGEDEGCTLCCKPRPPFAEAVDSVALGDVPVVVVAVLDDGSTSAAVRAPARSSALARERRTSDHRLLSPEGLAVFLI